MSRPLRCWGDGLSGSRPWTTLRDAPVWGMLVGPSGGCALRGAWSPDISPRGEDSDLGKLSGGAFPLWGLSLLWGIFP